MKKTFFGNFHNIYLLFIYFQRVGRLACSICDHYLMGSPVYVIMIGFIGTVSPHRNTLEIITQYTQI